MTKYNITLPVSKNKRDCYVIPKNTIFIGKDGIKIFEEEVRIDLPHYDWKKLSINEVADD